MTRFPAEDESQTLSHEFATQLASTAHLVGFKEVPFEGYQQAPLRYIAMEGNPTQPLDQASEALDNAPPPSPHILLFVCGMGGSTLSALPLLTGLRHEFDTMISLDLRGFGIHTNDGSEFDAETVHLGDLQALLRKLKKTYPTARFSIMGISLGSLLLCHALTRTPHEDLPAIQTLILLAPAFAPHPNTFKPWQVIQETFKFLLNPSKAKMQLPYGLSTLTKNPVYLENPIMEPPISLPLKYLLSIQAMQKTIMRRLPHLHVPVMMVIPGEDKVCYPKAMLEAFARLSHTSLPSQSTTAAQVGGHRLSVYPSSYHDVILEPELPWLIHDIISWLDYCHLCTPLEESP